MKLRIMPVAKNTSWRPSLSRSAIRVDQVQPVASMPVRCAASW